MPSLKAGSVLLGYISQFRKDPTNYTVALSTMIVKPMNCDFDGPKGPIKQQCLIRTPLIAGSLSQYDMVISSEAS